MSSSNHDVNKPYASPSSTSASPSSTSASPSTTSATAANISLEEVRVSSSQMFLAASTGLPGPPEADGETSMDDTNLDKKASDECTSQSQAAQAQEAETIAAAAAAADSDAGSEDKDDKDDGKKKKNRCATCRKKVGLTGFECRCGGLFCAVHRYSDKHDCSFNYREMGAKEIRRNNPVVVGEKIKKI